MSEAGRANSNQWMVDLATSAKREVDSWPAWKKENMGVSQSSGTGASQSSGGRHLHSPILKKLKK